MGADFWIVVQWWAVLFLVGAIAFPLAKRLFTGWWDGGYLFAKAVGMALVTYIVYLLGTLRILPFTQGAVWVAMGVVFGGGLLVTYNGYNHYKNYNRYKVVVLEELFFFAALLFWTWIKGHEPSIHALEKFMDFGFTKSILNSTFFPAADMWYAGSSINYYYFGHVVLAVLTRFSGIDLAYTFNLMLATIFALTLTMSFSIGVELILRATSHRGVEKSGRIVLDFARTIKAFIGGILAAFFVTLAGNLQTIYAFTAGYTGDNPPPFWQLGFSLEGLTKYWYANATRFIPFTIHEFPSYSFVVSDVHGHVLSLPFVLLAIGLLIKIGKVGDMRGIGEIIFYGFLVAVLLMTNALDGPIYLGLFTAVLVWGNKGGWGYKGKVIAMVGIAAILTSLPFLLHFKSFVSGIGVNCPPGSAGWRIGPFLFETAEKCQRSPLWMFFLLWGFFLYCGGWFFLRKAKLVKLGKLGQLDKLLFVFFVFSIGLIIFPEFFYFKDIYPAHFRSNTMFKLGYQAFILLSMVSAYSITTAQKKVFFLLLSPLLFLVSIYPIFSVRSYFNSLKTYEGIYGLGWFAREYPDDFAAVEWFNAQTAVYHLPPRVLVEAEGDSYSDAARVSAFTGIPTVVGWPVHEWLWRGSYDVVGKRRDDVRRIYESHDPAEVRRIVAKYNVRFIMVGTLERSKYPDLAEEKFLSLGHVVFRSGQTVVYEVGY